MTVMIRCFLILLLAGLGACSRPVDLETPCPDYGRYCTQTPINAWDNDHQEQ
ncbi:TPA: hypothetical protein QH041_003114 [Legionella pneumophila]|nr:hypothetical protein [Legionella pneumophila]HDS3863223.1 hypothetical protein [Legionella pneumophila]